MSMAGNAPRRVARTPREAWKLGIATVPEDRKTDGLIMQMSSRDNIMIGDLSKCSRAGVMRGGLFDSRSTEFGRLFGLNDRMLEQPVRELSGGNQQKILLARWKNRVPAVLLVDEATRGIDVGAKRRILLALRDLARQGLAIIFVSSDLEEVAAISDRVYVLRHGTVVGELDRQSEAITQDRILQLAFGIGADSPGRRAMSA